jgi:adenine-specific DNA-methyltransferase
MGKSLDECSREELIEIINSLKRQKKFGLVWEDKPEKVAEECKKKLPVLEEVKAKNISLDQNDPTNLLIEGDNYHALSVLNYTHAGKIDVIYIDPPYNTGNKDFIYNDRFVDKEDAFSHSKWLSFMEKRLKLVLNLLSEEGVIFISINDIELPYLRLLCDSIFKETNLIANIIWKCRNSLYYTEPTISTSTEYILCYAKNKSSFYLKAFDKDNIGGEKDLQGLFFNRVKKKYDSENYSNPDNDPNGPFITSGKIRNDGRPAYTVISPSGIKHTEAWVYTPDVFKKLDESGQIYWGKDGSAQPRKKSYYKDFIGNVSSNLLMDEIMRYKDENGKLKKEKYFEIGTTESGTKELKKILGKDVFPYPKPSTLIKYLIRLYPKQSATVLDFFAGSGTTGQAVLELNKEDNGCRQFILCTNNENQIAQEVTYPRIKTVITGVRGDGSKYSDGISANIRYFKTDFVEKERSTDATRQKLVDRSADMIRIREDAYEELNSASINKYYQSNDVFVAIIFDPFTMKEAWAEIENLNTEQKIVKLYIFSYSRDTSAFTDEIPKTNLKWEAVPIPESILQVYKRLFGGKK